VERSSYKSNRNVVYACHDHVVVTPKDRRSVLEDPVGPRSKELVGDASRDLGGQVVEHEVMPDHVHLLVSVDPQFGIHRYVKRLTGATSPFLRHEYAWLRSRLPTLWTNAHLVARPGGMRLDLVERYVEGQEAR
jgi:putative transposase